MGAEGYCRYGFARFAMQSALLLAFCLPLLLLAASRSPAAPLPLSRAVSTGLRQAQGLLGSLHNPQPAGPAPPLRLVARGDPRQPCVALTFDDGPKPGATEELLAVLRREKVKATFFYVGAQAERYPWLVQATARAGHEIGNHTYDHRRLPGLTSAEQAAEIDQTSDVIALLTGERPRFLRPPGGRRDARAEALLPARGMALAMWDAELGDIAPRASARYLEHEALLLVRPGSVVLLHSGVPATVEALPAIIAELRAKGYRFVTLSQLCQGLDPAAALSGRGANGVEDAGQHRKPRARQPQPRRPGGRERLTAP